jgi:outer membrane lipoprotein
MRKGTILAGIALLAAVLMVACAPPFPKELLAKIDRNISFADINRDPGQFVGKLVMLGGVIVETKNLQDATQFEILQKPLDRSGRPLRTDETGGRFLARSSRFYDAAVFQRGREITIIGTLEMPMTQRLGETEYRYPLVETTEVHLWPLSSGPRFSIGVGVYRGF